ncbi:MAG: LysE family transporter [Bacillus sp. (in: firmicutes)]
MGTSSLSYSGLELFSFSISCMAISWIWFFCLAFAGRQIGRLSHSTSFISYLNKISAVIIWGVAVYLMFSFK